MRFLELSLKAVGPFSNAVLDLSAGAEGLHVIYGPNEAGKTSALRALSCLLFGFPPRTDDAFLHPYDQLRVGATLRHSDGETLQVVRRKGNKNTLRAADDATAIAPGTLERYLGGIDQETFENLFGIDHGRLREAGDEIRTGKGRLGELLFAAGTGLAGLGQAKQRLQDRLDALFKPRGQNQRINQALAEYREAQEATRRAQLPSEEWMQHDLALREAEARADRLVEEIQGARRDLNRQARILSAIPQVARRRRLRDELERLGDVVRLRDSFGQETRAAQDAYHLALRTIEQARANIDEIEGHLAAAEPSLPLLEAAHEIEALTEELGAVEKGLKDRPQRESWMLENEYKARGILDKLRLPRDLDAARELRLRADEPTRIRGLAKQFVALRVQREEARSAIAKHEEQAARLERERATLGESRDVAALRRAVQRARKAGDLDTQHAQTVRALERADQQAELALARLPGWSGDLDSLERQAIPLDPTIDRFETEFQALESELRGVDAQRAAEDDAVKQLEARLRALDIQQDVPTEDDLRALRRRRDDGWRLLRAAGRTTGAPAPDERAYIEEFAPGRALADALEQGVARTDEVADRLRREAELVARKAEWLAQLDAHRAARDELARGRGAVEVRRDLQWKAWAEVLAPLQLAGMTPHELRAWLRLRSEVLQQSEHASAARLAADQLEHARTENRAALARGLGALGGCPSDPGEDLASLLEQAEGVLKAEERAAQRREGVEHQVVEVQADLARDRARLETTDVDLKAWRGEWSGMMARIGLEADAEPDQAEVVLAEMQALSEALAKRREFQSRIRGIDRDAEQFAGRVAALCGRVAPELIGPPPADVARALARRLGEERVAHQERANLAQQLDREAQRLREAEQEREASAGRLDRLRREAGCESADDLPDADRRSRDRARLEDDLQACEDQLLTLGGGLAVAEFAARVERADADDLGPDIARREAAIEALETELHAVKEVIGGERGALNRWVGGDDAAQASEKAQGIAARLQADVALYAKLKLAASVLNRSIDRYRDKSQGPVLARASEIFRTTTAGSFDRLQIEDDDGRAVLKGVRADGRLVGVEGMSDGSHDQLYLALRLASLEAWLNAHEPVPFVVDDILLNFDDRRALASLHALAGLSRRTQVLFFTHHPHLVALAREHLPADVVSFRELPGP